MPRKLFPKYYQFAQKFHPQYVIFEKIVHGSGGCFLRNGYPTPQYHMMLHNYIFSRGKSQGFLVYSSKYRHITQKTVIQIGSFVQNFLHFEEKRRFYGVFLAK